VRADVYLPGQPKIVVMSTMETDGGKAWKVVLDGNEKSFEDVFNINNPLDIIECQKVLKNAAAQAFEKLRLK
jgi:hypothetical protein